ncbi:MAG TPA: tRNA (adenosine(37)-N6)-dimethylallyltransferase MiaA [Firmicutes bacterium]|nr:tRNA (adenosine(37)-N6)-dimethylallyltransferase MiaA [Bacillota bacterium]
MIPLLVLAGPTAAGKTELAVETALRLNGEIISADSMQVYRRMDIGTAKPTGAERKGVPHYLIDIVDPDEEYNVARFQADANQAIEDIAGRGKLPMLVGGTGLYLNAVIFSYQFSDCQAEFKELRASLLNAASEKGSSRFLHRRLQEVDPESARKIHPNDLRRIVRALEVYYVTGKPISLQIKETKRAKSSYSPVIIGLKWRRDCLYERIDRRVDGMLKRGFLAEVQGLLQDGYSPALKSMQSLGYAHLARHLMGELSLNEAVEELKRDTRRYAKRQMTWFRKLNGITWINMVHGTEEEKEEAVEKICSLMQENTA